MLAGGGAAAYGFAIHEKQPGIDPTTGAPVFMEGEDEETFIRSHAQSADTGALEIPVYEELALVRSERTILIGADAGFYKDWLNTRSDFFGRTQALFPSSAIRQSEDGSYFYVMYDTEVGNRLYLYYPKDKEPYPRRYQLGFPVLMAKKLSYEDFATLKPGDGIDKVEAIDTVIMPYRRLFDLANALYWENLIKRGTPPTSVHLLSDGIFKIEYARNAADDYVITSLIYRPDFVLDGLDGTTCYRIAEVDYVK